MSNAVLNRERKFHMLERTQKLFSSYNNYMLVGIDKVQSTQFKNIARALPPKMEILFSKNKIIKKVLRELDSEKYAEMIDSIKGNVLVIFFDGEDPRMALEASLKNMRDSFAVPGDIATAPIVIPAGPTGLAPEKIIVFQNARIQTKINKGKIDIAVDHLLVKTGETVTISNATLLKWLNIMPFKYGLDIIRIYEGSESYGRDILFITDSTIEESLRSAVSEITAISLGTGVPTEASVPYTLANSFVELKKMMLGLGIGHE